MPFVKGSKKDLKILFLFILLYIVIIFAFNFWKYYTNKYNVLDLAIFNQVFWNLTHGNGLYSSIQQNIYLGDHAEFFIFLLYPFYKLLPHPLTLLTLQTIGLASAAFPIYFLARLILNYNNPNKNKGMALRTSTAGSLEPAFSKQSPPQTNNKIALLVSLLWLINPIVWNINFFEFHILPFAVPLLLWAIYFYLTDRHKLFFLFLFLSLLVREDVALITLLLGLIILIKNKKLGFLTILLSGGWFLGSTKLIAQLSTDQHYKYLSYYSWLGSNFSEILKNIFLHPWNIIKHISTLPNAEMIIGFLMAFFLLPIFKPKFLALAIIPLLQFLLNTDGGGALVFQTHYGALFLPSLAVSSIFGLKYITEKFKNHHGIIMIILLITAIYNFIALGPLPETVKTITDDVKNKSWWKENELINKIPKNSSVATTYKMLTRLSSRENISALHYLYVGKKQFSKNDYIISEAPEYLVIDENDLKTFKVQYESLAWSSKTAPEGFNHIMELIERGNYGLLKNSDGLVVLKKDLGRISGVYQLQKIETTLHGYITLNGIRSGETVFLPR